MIIEREQDVTAAALAVMEQTSDPRMRQIMRSLVEHLHAFVREVRLTEKEFRDATAVIAELGKLSTDTHNEVVLMAGSLGVSSLVCLLNNGDQGNTETDQSLLGPFWRLNSPRVENGGSIVRSETPGRAAVRQRPRRGQGRPSRCRRRGRCLARVPGRPLREPGSRTG
jgi:catechol 1,2-dioxygenase